MPTKSPERKKYDEAKRVAKAIYRRAIYVADLSYKGNMVEALRQYKVDQGSGSASDVSA